MSTAKPKIVDIANLMPRSLIEMVRQLPTNPMIRTQVHAVIRVPIPDDKATFLQIKEWLECEYPTIRDQAKIKITASSTPFEDDPVPVAPAIRLGMGGDNDFEPITQTVRYRYTEIGTARYTEDRIGTGEYDVEGSDLEEYFHGCLENGYDLDRFVGMVKEALEATCLEESPETEPESEDARDYDNHESCDSTNHRASVTSMENLRRSCIDWIESNHYDERGAFGLP